jgi:hypothetical protein
MFALLAIIQVFLPLIHRSGVAAPRDHTHR